MTAMVHLPLSRGAGAPAAFVASATGTIVLAFRAISELWCRPLGAWVEGSNQTIRFVLAVGEEIRAQNILRKHRDLAKAQASNHGRFGRRDNQ
jgi:hypothetical protein